MQVGKSYSVPDERLYPKVLDWTKQIYDEFSTSDTDSLSVAQLLGHTSIGGAFNAKVASMSAYGVVERRLGRIRVTEIGRKAILSEDGKEKADGVKSALLKVALWKRLYNHYTAKGAELPADFWADLAKIADIPGEDAKSKAEWVVKAFNSDIAYLRSTEKEKEMLGSSQRPQKKVTQSVPKAPSRPISPPSEPDPKAPSRPISPPPSEPDPKAPSRPISPPPSESSGQIIFLSPFDQIELTVPRRARHMAMLKKFIENALDVIDEELTAEGSMAAERNKSAEKR
ncbi:MAG: hypothetical protein E6K84_01140 [Thaumarchaeota archaeon]|nr:MAG: hypothetical protein E6K84_01140 [Nitrososphaerota archaeon]